MWLKITMVAGPTLGTAADLMESSYAEAGGPSPIIDTREYP